MIGKQRQQKGEMKMGLSQRNTTDSADLLIKLFKVRFRYLIEGSKGSFSRQGWKSNSVADHAYDLSKAISLNQTTIEYFGLIKESASNIIKN